MGGSEIRSIEIGTSHLIPAFSRTVGSANAGAPTAHPGVIHDDIEPAEPLIKLIEKVFDGTCLGQVHRKELCISAQLLHFSVDLGALVMIAADKSKLGALADKAMNDAAANPRVAA